jgi:hypothetical protein
MILKRGQQEILLDAAQGKIELYVEMSASLALLSVDKRQVRHAKNRMLPNRRQAEPMPAFCLEEPHRFLEIDVDQCQHLLNNDRAQQAVFTYALCIEGDGSMARKRATAPMQSPDVLRGIGNVEIELGKLMRCFATYHPTQLLPDALGFPHPIDISLDSTYITRQTVIALGRPSQIQLSGFTIHVQLPAGEHISRELTDLYNLLVELRTTSATEGQPLISSQDIFDILENKYGFSKNKAGFASKVIENATIEEDDAGVLTLHAPEMLALIACSEDWRYALNNRKRYPSNEKIIDKLKSEYKFPKGRAEVAAGIIRPESATKGGRPPSF